jgi:membrane-bound lytic murein transglycosylase D
MNRLLSLTLFLIFSFSLYAIDDIPKTEDLMGSSWVDNGIDMPESLNTNLDSLLQDWHIKNYRPIYNKCDCDSVNPYFSDEVIKKRLASIPTVIPMTYNEIVRKFIDVYSDTKRKQMEVMLGLSEYYFPYFENALEKYGLPLELKYLPVVESALNPCAVSRAGASGLWQFMYGTGRIYGLDINTLVDERRDPFKSSDAAVRYLKDLYGIFGDWQLAIAAYNCGPGNVNKAIRRSGGKHNYWDIYYYLPRETRGYVPLFIAANYVMRNHKEHKICPVQMNFATLTDTIQLNRKIHFDQVCAVIGIPKDELKSMNPQYRMDIIPGSPETPYSLCLPSSYTLSFIDNIDSIPRYHADELLMANTITEPTAIPAPVRDYRMYKVRRGDTLSTIADRHHVTVTKLKRWNGMHTSRIRPGQRLKIF